LQFSRLLFLPPLPPLPLLLLLLLVLATAAGLVVRILSRFRFLLLGEETWGYPFLLRALRRKPAFEPVEISF